MPHVDIKCFPRDLNDEQKTALAEDIAEVIIRHFNSKDSSVSVALNQVNQEDWKAQVWDTEIGPKLDELIKKPGYSMSPRFFPASSSRFFAKIDKNAFYLIRYTLRFWLTAHQSLGKISNRIS